MPMSIVRDPFVGLPHLKKDKSKEQKVDQDDDEDEEDEEAKQEETGAVSITESDEDLTSCSSSDSNDTDSDSESSSSDDEDSPKNEGLNEQAFDYQSSAYYAYAQAEYVCNSGSIPNNSVISPNSIPSPANANMNTTSYPYPYPYNYQYQWPSTNAMINMRQYQNQLPQFQNQQVNLPAGISMMLAGQQQLPQNQVQSASHPNLNLNQYSISQMQQQSSPSATPKHGTHIPPPPPHICPS